ncbi:MAG TPA: DUF2203 domain-containing protein [Verrucomicrobiales bacterium]|nr:DUF2203 domain-containing protein [Verrucomicrobiales bacterium]
MNTRFQHHYTREEARQLLPQVEEWLVRLEASKKELERSVPRVESLLEGGADLGGGLVVRYLSAYLEFKGGLAEFSRREILIKDLDRGLVDFPAFMAGREVFLCWERGEPDIEHWHDLDTGFAGRAPIEE